MLFGHERESTQARAAEAVPTMTKKEAGKLGGRGTKAPDIIRGFGYGTDADYLTARIASERPDILERMKPISITSPIPRTATRFAVAVLGHS